MVANSKLAVALHVVTALGYNEGTFITSERLGFSVDTNPVVIRRIIADLARAGIVESRRGKSGGAQLARAADQISLLEVYRAIDGMTPFCLPKPGSERCVVAACMPDVLKSLLSDIDGAIEDTLGARTVADLVTQVEAHRAPSKAGVPSA